MPGSIMGNYLKQPFKVRPRGNWCIENDTHNETFRGCRGVTQPSSLLKNGNLVIECITSYQPVALGEKPSNMLVVSAIGHLAEIKNYHDNGGCYSCPSDNRTDSSHHKTQKRTFPTMNENPCDWDNDNKHPKKYGGILCHLCKG